MALVVKNPPTNAGDIRDASTIPGLGRSPGRWHGNPLQYSCLENSMDRGAWKATVHMVAKSRTQLKGPSTHVHSLQLQGQSHSLRPVGIVAVYIMSTVWSSRSFTWYGVSMYNTAYKIWLNIIYSPWGWTKGLWLCLMTKQLLIGLLWLFSFVSMFSHFFD